MIRLLVLTLATAAASPAPGVEVRLRATATCSASVVRLVDVADVVASDVRLGQAVAEVPLCPAPAAGATRTLTAADIWQMVLLSGVERRECRVTGSERVEISFQAGGASATTRQPVIASGVRQAIFTPDPQAGRLPVRPTALVRPPEPATKPSSATLVERNATVTVIARAAGVRITASGKALEAGGEGESINVELADTKQKVLARVTGPQIVEMAASGIQ